MKLLITAVTLFIFSNVTYAWEKMTVEEMKKEIGAKVQVCPAESNCGKHLSDLNNESTCSELRNFLKRHGIVVRDPQTQAELDVANVVYCREE